jgi:spore coat polysaccharide biosynthesis protein SpsF
MGILVFSRYDSSRLPGKALRLVGGIPLLERVIRRAQLLPWPVYLATTTKSSDDALVTLAEDLGVPSYRGSAERVLERAVLAAEAFGLDAFARLCGDRPLFPLDTLDRAVRVMEPDGAEPDLLLPDLVTNDLGGCAVPGLMTEVARTATLRQLLNRGVSAEQQEHVTLYFYDHPDEFRILGVEPTAGRYSCPGFAVDTESDMINLNRIFAACPAIDLTVTEADRIYRS